ATAGSGEKKEGTRETVLVGKRVPQREAYYARVLGDDGVVQLPAKQLDVIQRALVDPGKIRSKDIAAFDAKNADVVVLKQGEQVVKLYRPEADKDWKLQTGSGPAQKANDKATQALLEAVQGKNAILHFDDPAEGEQKKYDEEWGLEKPGAVITVYTSGL